MRTTTLFSLAFPLALTACTGGPAEPEGPVTYHQDIAPILSLRCSGCHTDGSIAEGVQFDDYDTASALSALIVERVESGAMPPFPADETAECPNPWGFQHDPRLSDHEVGALVAWHEAETPEGDPDDAAPLPGPVVQALQGVNQVLRPAGPWTVKTAAEVSDEFMCMTLDPGLTEDGWLEGIEVGADNLTVLHHVVITVDTAGDSAALAGPDGWYECFGGAMTSGGSLVGGWIPGAAPIEVPPGSAIRVPAGARLVAQMHYHGAATPQVDASEVRLRWTSAPPTREAFLQLTGNATGLQTDGTGLQPGPADSGLPEFRIPAGATGHTETSRHVIDEGGDSDIAVFLVANHMHYVGVRMRAWVEPGPGSPTPDVQCLLDTPEWDFDWQLLYRYDVEAGRAPIVHSGDVLVIECTYDNTLANPSVAEALAETGLDAPIDVRLGEGTLDEMCMVAVGGVPL